MSHGLRMKQYVDSRGKTVLAPEGIDATKLGPQGRFYYTTALADQIVERYAEGTSLAGMAKFGLPAKRSIIQWMHIHTDFARRMREARKLRGLIHEEKALEIATDAKEENLGVAKLQVETHKWAAEVSDAETYGKKKQEGTVGPTTIIINTGVPDSEVEVKSEVVSIPPSPISLEELL